MESPKTGRAIPNQFIIEDATITYTSRTGEKITPPRGRMFQSYDSNIAFKGYTGPCVVLDVNKWDYSRTTGKYRNEFLKESMADTRRKIESGEYILEDLNK
jgi:hypothetical protein